MSKEKQETGYVYILTNPSFRVDEPVPDDS